MGVWFGMSEVGVMADEAQDYAILVSLATLEEAEVMASAIRADGIDAFIGNRHHLNVDWGYTLALGGVQVLVPRAKLDEAREGIRARVREAAADPAGEPVQRTDRYKVWLVIAWTLGWSGYVYWLNSLERPAPVYEMRVGLGKTYFAAPFDLSLADQEAVLLDYCRDNPSDDVVEPSSDLKGDIIPCGDVLVRN